MWWIEKSPNRAATCKSCGARIDKGEWRVGETGFYRFWGWSPAYRHLECWFVSRRRGRPSGKDFLKTILEVLRDDQLREIGLEVEAGVEARAEAREFRLGDPVRSIKTILGVEAGEPLQIITLPREGVPLFEGRYRWYRVEKVDRSWSVWLPECYLEPDPRLIKPGDLVEILVDEPSLAKLSRGHRVRVEAVHYEGRVPYLDVTGGWAVPLKDVKKVEEPRDG